MRRTLLLFVPLALLIAIWLSRVPPLDVPDMALDDSFVEKGEYLITAGGCIACHSEEDELPPSLAGGRALDTPFGTFYAPNITPDEETGIGAWSNEDFVRAMRYGISPAGSHYYPAFPYTSYTGLSTQDLLAMRAYLATLEPVERQNRPHQLAFYVSFRPLLRFFKLVNFRPGEFKPDRERSQTWNRGAYLVRHLGHCAECHTPRNPLGGLDAFRPLEGTEHGPDGDPVPGITTDKEHGIGDWSRADLAYFLESGFLPDGDVVGGSMGEVIEGNTSQLTSPDREAIAAYLLSAP